VFEFFDAMTLIAQQRWPTGMTCWDEASLPAMQEPPEL
jgi:hypothetical protein